MEHFFDHIKDGVSQSERYLPALRPSYVKIDERSPADLLMLLTEIATQFNYYNGYDTLDGDWKEFLQGDMLVMLESIARLDFTSFQQSHQQIKEGLENAGTEQQLQTALSALFNLMYGIALLLGGQLQLLKQADQDAETWEYIDQVMESLEEDVYLLLTYEKQALALFRPGTSLHTVAVQQLFYRSYEKAAHFSDTNTFHGYESLNEVYNKLRAKFYQVTSSAQYSLRTRPAQGKHHPHIGLLLAFLSLYEQLQEQINQLTERHLSYYYTTILGIPFRPASPDSVHVLIVPGPTATPQLLPFNTLLPADIVKGQPPVLYRLLHDVPVTQAKIKSLRTLFVSHHKQVSAHSLLQQDVTETQVYAQTQVLPDPKAYMPGAPPVTAWPMLGEDQVELCRDKRSMEDTEMGFILASPVLYVTEGKRTVVISLYAEATSLSIMNAYIRNLQLVMNRSEDTLKGELFATAFFLYYTTAAGWHPIQRYSARLKGNCITITFQLDVTAPAAAYYQSAIHGEQLACKLPMLKVLLNNNSFHHPYSFLQYFKLERIAIQADVKGYRSLLLQNNVGPLSPGSPFQPFGPQPAPGTYLQLRDSNVFNRYTRQFSIHLEWLDLPTVEGGFDTWYKDYHAGMTNDAFKAGISVSKDGQFTPLKGKQQMVSLFNTWRDLDGRLFLSDKTVLDDIDLNKISFNNKPLLEKEILTKDSFYADGVVRLELAEPSPGFGQRLYTQLFPDVVAHNARLWAKKQPIPNPPYIPLIKSIAVDYTLEQAEILKPDKTSAGTHSLQVFHLYPFGYQQAYPAVGQSSFMLLPQFTERAHLYIGIDNAQPQELLSFLFQLEEKHYTNTTGTIQPYHWSYLHNDRWYPLDQENILADSTLQFIQSGVVVIKMPPNIETMETQLGKGLKWLCLSATAPPVAHPMVHGIFLNAGVARRESGGILDSGHLPPLTIKSLEKDVRGIQQVLQLFPSFGGRPAETKDEYYVRVSERLRHKQRPVLGIDIIQLVLDAFPNILIAKCIGNKPGQTADLQLVVVPRQTPGHEQSAPRADLATLYKIRDYAEKLLPAYIQVEVHNPLYEKVKVICDVCFSVNSNRTDNNYYMSRLQEDIRRFITPWLFNGGADLSIGSSISKSDMISYIKKLPYVAYVTAFSLVHFFPDQDPYTGEPVYCALDTAIDDVAFIKGSKPEAVLIPALHHTINIIDEWRYRDPAPMGINSMITGEEMIVGRKIISGYQQESDSHYMEGEMITLTIHAK